MGKPKGPRVTFTFSFKVRGSWRLRVPGHAVVLATGLALYPLAHGPVLLAMHVLAHLCASTTR